MKTEEVTKAVLNGKIVFVGTYLSGRVDEIVRRNPKTGQSETFHICRQVVIGEMDALPVTKFLRDTDKPLEWKPPFKKGQQVVVMVSGMQVEKGNTILNGEIEALA